MRVCFSVYLQSKKSWRPRQQHWMIKRKQRFVSLSCCCHCHLVSEEVNKNVLKGAELLAKGAACLSVSGVYFTCPLTGATLSKSEREAHVKEAILMVRL